MLSRKIPVMAKNWMKLCFCLIALATKPNDFFGVGIPASAADGGAMTVLIGVFVFR
ncbi:hypothetical protein Hanom_Chr08g00696231 [Helianthus anomalus]